MSDPNRSTKRKPFPLKPSVVVWTVVFVLVGVLLPVVCFLLVFAGAPEEPDWQSGRYADYAWLLLGGSRTWAFYPFLIYCMLCLSVTLLRPETGRRYFVVRFGVYTGTVVAVQFTYVLGTALFDIDGSGGLKDLAVLLLGIPLASLVAIGVPMVGWFLLWIVIRLWQRSPSRIEFMLITGFITGIVVAVCVAGATHTSPSSLLFAIPVLLILGSLASAPSWAAAVYACQSVRLWRQQPGRLQLRLRQVLIVFTWIAAYLAAWRAAVVLMLQAYTQLPTEPPDNCYIATAAARGHGRFVGSHRVLCRDGSTRRVNMQLAYFKCGEIALQATLPGFHRAIRHAYDTLGPRLARWLVHPLAADAVYLALKPLEWLTRAALAVLIGDTSIAQQMYGNEFPKSEKGVSDLRRP